MTGANGLIGSALVRRLASEGRYQLRAAGRRIGSAAFPQVETFVSGDLALAQDWTVALKGVTTVVHTAARVHMPRDSSIDSLRTYRQINVEAALTLARQAVTAGARRFIFLSSIKVNGEASVNGEAFRAHDVPAPQGPYAVSKFEAEQGLKDIAASTGLEVVILRPPLVYGPGVAANFQSMLRAVRLGLPLPFGAVRNRRSFLALDNLTDLLVHCVEHPGAADRTFLASDGDDVSTPELLRRAGDAVGRPARLVSVPVPWLQRAAALLGRQDAIQRLCESLFVDMAPTRELLGWAPPISMKEGLRRTVVVDARETHH